MCVIVRPPPYHPPNPSRLSSASRLWDTGVVGGAAGTGGGAAGAQEFAKGLVDPGFRYGEEVGDPVLFQNSAERESVSLQGVSGASTTAFSGDVARFGPRPVPKSGARMMGPTEKPVSKPVSSLAIAGERPRAQNRPNPPISSAGPVARQRRAHRRTPLPVAEPLKRLHDISL